MVIAKILLFLSSYLEAFLVILFRPLFGRIFSFHLCTWQKCLCDVVKIMPMFAVSQKKKKKKVKKGG